MSGSVLSTLHIKSHLSSYWYLRSLLSTLHIQSHLILSATLRKSYYYCPYFYDWGNWSLQSLANLPMVKQMLNAESGPKARKSSLTPKSILLTTTLYCSAVITLVKIIATVYWAQAIIARHFIKYFAYFRPFNLHIKCMKIVSLFPFWQWRHWNLHLVPHLFRVTCLRLVSGNLSKDKINMAKDVFCQGRAESESCPNYLVPGSLWGKPLSGV